jgi:CRISPR-associated protein Cmr2
LATKLTDTACNLAWGIAYCLAYDRQFDDASRTRLQRLIEQEPMPQALRNDDVTIIAEAARRIIESSDEKPPTKEALRQSRLAQLNEWLGNPAIALVMGGATKIKQYVFESLKLPEIRGASGLLDRINLRDVRALFAQEPRWLEELRNPNSDDTRELAEGEALVKQVRAFFTNAYGIEPLDCEACIVYANGGEVLAFAPTQIAEYLAAAIERRYTLETTVAASVAVWHSCSLLELRYGVRPLEFWLEDLHGDEALRHVLTEYYDDLNEKSLSERKTFGEIASLLALKKLQRREGNEVDGRAIRPVPSFETNIYARRCKSCEIRNAIIKRPFEDDAEGYWFCEPCARKHIFGQRAKKEKDDQVRWFTLDWKPTGAKAWSGIFDDWLNRAEHSGLRQVYYENADDWAAQAPTDLNDIAAAAKPEGFIGVIYADGNNMGSLLEGLRTPAEYQVFAESVYEAIKDATFTAIAEHLRPVLAQEKQTHPFEVLNIGGDDVFLIVPAHAALPVAMRIAEVVQDKLRECDITRKDRNYVWQGVHRVARRDTDDAAVQSQVSLSSGVVIAGQHTPILLMRRLAEELLHSAKRKAKTLREAGCYSATVDFVSLKSIGMIANNVDEFRRNALQHQQHHWTAKPYTLPELRALLEIAQEFKACAFPQSQLYRLRKQIERGWLASSVDYLYFRSRLSKEHAEKLCGMLDERWTGIEPHGRVADIGLWLRRDDSDWETVLGDLVEIYDFVLQKGDAKDDPDGKRK